MQLEVDDLIKLYNRIDELERRVALLENAFNDHRGQIEIDGRPSFPTDCANGKYKALSEYLYEKWEKRIVLSYEQIEEILGFSLPASAYSLAQSYWANTEYHSYAKSWLKLGYKAKVDVRNQKVMFERNIY